MRSSIYIYIFFLIFFISCQESSEPLRAWGEASNNLQLSLDISDDHLTEGESGIANLLVKNISDEQITHELYATFNLYDEENILRYISYFNLMAEDMISLYESSKTNPKSNFVISPNDQREYQIDISKLGWVQPQDSRPPYAEFYDLIQKNKYIFVSELHLISNGEVHSNLINVEIK
ncbi:MAG: hypothetical protein AB7W47_04055 [Calditrichaceae bacterium]